jgi:hypothetical protein
MRLPALIILPDSAYPAVNPHIHNFFPESSHSFTFAQIWSPKVGVKREVRCKAGAIPVAVSSTGDEPENVYTAATVPLSRGGKAVNREQARRPARWIINH